MATRQEVYAAIDGERAYQDQLWQRDLGTTDEGVPAFLIYMQKYLDKANDAFTGIKGDASIPALDMIRKVVALGVCAMEVNGAPKREGF